MVAGHINPHLIVAIYKPYLRFDADRDVLIQTTIIPVAYLKYHRLYSPSCFFKNVFDFLKRHVPRFIIFKRTSAAVSCTNGNTLNFTNICPSIILSRLNLTKVTSNRLPGLRLIKPTLWMCRHVWNLLSSALN